MCNQETILPSPVVKVLQCAQASLALLVLALAVGCATGHPPAAKPVQLSAPATQSAPTSHVLGPGDEVQVNVWRQESLHKSFIVPPGGWVTFPLAGDVQASGLTPLELRDRIRDGLLPYFKDPQVSVEVIAYRSSRVYILGEVQRPGVQYLTGVLSAVEAVSHAGGFTTNAKTSEVLLLRPGDTDHSAAVRLDLAAALSEASREDNISLRGGDVLYVPSTYLADLSRTFQHIASILYPFVELGRGIVLYPSVEDVITGKDTGTTVIVR